MSLWQKPSTPPSPAEIASFTTGNDRKMDLMLARFDVLGSLAHILMLESVGLLSEGDREVLSRSLRTILADIDAGKFTIEDGIEDVHSQVELLLTRQLGDSGKKIHSGRSRNDQVLVDIKLYLRHEIQVLSGEVFTLFQLLIALSEKHKDQLLPGYTHLQLAMPSSFGLWFGAYAESLVDDMITLQAAYQVVNKNPLGSAAGYGSSFPINRTLTTKLLGFEDLNYNVVYAQMGRGKAERIVADALSNFGATLARLSMDACLFLNQNFGFISFPEELTTGSSIMPHKKNPDVFELIRAHGNRLQALPGEIRMMTANLPSGYHRDLQLLKEVLFPAFENLKQCFRMTNRMLSDIRITPGILQDEKYKYLFSVEEVNKLVWQGIPFRDAYRKIGEDIQSGKFTYSTTLKHTHEGSLGNLCNDQIQRMMQKVLGQFHFEQSETAEKALAGR